jgi:hypothetical protein
MILIRQRRSYECGIAVAAMLGGIPYEGVLDRLITGLAPEACLSELVMWRVLEDITQAAPTRTALDAPSKYPCVAPPVCPWTSPAGGAMMERLDLPRFALDGPSRRGDDCSRCFVSPGRPQPWVR